MSSPVLTRADYTGFAAIQKARQENLVQMFGGTRLTFAKYSREKALKDIVSDASKVGKQTKKMIDGAKSGAKTASALSQAGDIQSNTHEFLQIATNLPDLTSVQEAIGMEVAHSLVGEMAPFFGVVVSSYKSAKSWRAVVKNAADLYHADYYLEGVLPGDPTAAAEAVIVVIKRFLAANTADAVRNTASAATKIAGLFADMGTATTAAVGAASALAKLIQELVILGRDYKEMKAANKLLLQPGKIDLNVFKEAPVLGCYLIACSDTSMIANFFIADMGLPGWMTKIEAMKKNQLDPLIRNANKAIVSSHLTLEGLQTNKGALTQKGTLDKLKESISYHFNRLVSSNASRSLKT